MGWRKKNIYTESGNLLSVNNFLMHIFNYFFFYFFSFLGREKGNEGGREKGMKGEGEGNEGGRWIKFSNWFTSKAEKLAYHYQRIHA